MNVRVVIIVMFMFLLSTSIYGLNPLSVYVANNNTNYIDIQKEDIFNYKQSTEWRKFKMFRACGWTALGVGSTMVVVGSIVCAVATNSEAGGGIDPLVAIPCVGGGLCIASIPLFVYANKNWHKALSLGATSQTIHLPMQTKQQLAVALRFTF